MKEGDKVAVRWTCCHRQMSGFGVVTRVNKCTIHVRLSHPVQSDIGLYPIGHGVMVPVEATPFNGAMPLDPMGTDYPDAEDKARYDAWEDARERHAAKHDENLDSDDF